MKRFSFRLEKVLSLREHQERELEIAFGKAAGRCLALKGDIETRRREIRDSFLRRNDGMHDLSYRRYTDMYIHRLHGEIAALTRRLKIAEKEREEARVAFVEASTRRKTLGKLKEKREAAYYREQARLEGKVIDEIGANAAVKREFQ